MSLFLTDTERSEIHALRKQLPAVEGLYWALLNRVERRAASPGLTDRDTTTEWWHHAAEYVSEAAMAHALKPSKVLAAWLRDVTLSLVRRPVDDWVGPHFRNHSTELPLGHLETAHLCWAVGSALDLAPGIFSDAERQESLQALREKGLALCVRWLDDSAVMANWRCVLTAGLSVAAAVTGDVPGQERARKEFLLCQHVFQPDGSHGESLQYGHYAAFSQMISWEALTRSAAPGAEPLPLEPYVHMPRWQAASLFYHKPLEGWGSEPLARSANFNDSAAIFRPSADVLLHIAGRGRERHPKDAGLARWLFDTHYGSIHESRRDDRHTFGFVNTFGFLAMSLLSHAATVEALSPQQAGLTTLEAFSCGDVLARDAWDGRTILAVHGGGDPLCGPGHLHGDLNSFILVHNQERLLVDPGHSCYRNLLHGLEVSTQTHNTCTFAADSGKVIGIEEQWHRRGLIEQNTSLRRLFDRSTRQPQPPADRKARRILLDRIDDVAGIGSEAGALYGEPITRFSRLWFQCGAHVLFIIDRIEAAVPVKTTWNWLLNNRDDRLELKIITPDRLVARRGDAGMKLFHLAGGSVHGPTHAYVHDAYHPLPNQLGEGHSGSGALVRWGERKAVPQRTAVHAICMDRYGPVAGWHLRVEDGYAAVLEAPGGSSTWKLKLDADNGCIVEETVSGRRYEARRSGDVWQLQKAN